MRIHISMIFLLLLMSSFVTSAQELDPVPFVRIAIQNSLKSFAKEDVFQFEIVDDPQMVGEWTRFLAHNQTFANSTLPISELKVYAIDLRGLPRLVNTPGGDQEYVYRCVTWLRVPKESNVTSVIVGMACSHVQTLSPFNIPEFPVALSPIPYLDAKCVGSRQCTHVE